MFYIKISNENYTIIDKIFYLISGIILANNRNEKVIIYDDDDENLNDQSIKLNDVLNFSSINKFLKNKYNIIVVNKNNFNFDLINITYGFDVNIFDLTDEIKKKSMIDDSIIISKELDLNSIMGDPIQNIIKKLFIRYKIDNYNIEEIYDEYRDSDIILNSKNPNYTCVSKNLYNNQDFFDIILVNLCFNKLYTEKIDYLNNLIDSSSKINLIDLNFDEKLIENFANNNNMEKNIFMEKIEEKYINLIKKYTNPNDQNIILTNNTDNQDNKVIEFLKNNNYNFIFNEIFFDNKDENYIVDLSISKYFNKMYIGFYDDSNPIDFSFSYYASKLADTNTLKICFNPNKIINDEFLF
jgi:hypothetical protein